MAPAWPQFARDVPLTLLHAFSRALVVIRLFLFCAMSGLMWNTVLFRFGLIGMLCDKFKWLVASFAISSCLSVAEMTSRGSELGSGGNKAGVSSGGGMQSLSIINTIGARCALRAAHTATLYEAVSAHPSLSLRARLFFTACLVLYAACFQTMVDLANADLYDTTKWIGSRGASAGR